jgi:hypothetical protein
MYRKRSHAVAGKPAWPRVPPWPGDCGALKIRMKTPGLVWIAVAALTLALPGSAVDSVSWGSPVKGLRLGISLAPELHVFLENVGSSRQDFVIGHGSSVDLRFIATSPDGKEREGYEIHSFIPDGGLVLPVVVRLDPGARHELSCPLQKIICIEKPGDVTFEALAKQGASIHVFFETDEKTAAWAGLSSPLSSTWIGKVISGVAGL